MSRAFVKEDVDPPERSGRMRSTSGLPPGAINYMTAEGAARWRAELARLRRDETANAERIAEIEQILASREVVAPSEEATGEIAFGARVIMEDADGRLSSYRIVGVDELEFGHDHVSWVSPIGRALLAAKVGDRVKLDDDRAVRIVSVEGREG